MPTLKSNYTNVVFPANANVVNVLNYGAKGNGTDDDTAAIQAAINAALPSGRFVYFPDGTYNLSNTLFGKDASGNWQSGLILQGQSQTSTILKLVDGASGFNDVNNPKNLIMTGSSNPNNTTTGEGNQAFYNSIKQMTIDVGSNNAGVRAVSWLANNQAIVEDVFIKSSDPQYKGHTGLSCDRNLPGPCLIKNLTVVGFEYGIWVKDGYSVTGEYINLSNQRTAGINVPDTATLNIRKLTSSNSVVAFKGEECALTLIDSVLSGGNSSTIAIQNELTNQYTNGFVYLRNVQASGYSELYKDSHSNNFGITGEVNRLSVEEYYTMGAYSEFTSSKQSLDLPVKETPIIPTYAQSNWIYAGDPSGSDDTSAIQAALNSGNPLIYFQSGGLYKISSSLTIPASVKVIEGLGAYFTTTGNNFNNASNPQPVFYVSAGSDMLSIRGLRPALFPANEPQNAGAQFLVNNSNRSFLIKECNVGWTDFVSNSPSSGSLENAFFEDYAGSVVLNAYQKVWARQFNPETRRSPQILNNGADFWIFGTKTETLGIEVLESNNGSKTEMIGAEIFPISTPGSNVPCLKLNDSQLSFVGSSNSSYTIVVQETQKRVTKNLNFVDVSKRGNGFIIVYI